LFKSIELPVVIWRQHRRRRLVISNCHGDFPMRLTLPLLSLALLLSAAAPADAADAPRIEQRLTPEQFHATGLDTLSSEQLELLNRLLQEAPAAQSVASPSAAPDGNDTRRARAAEEAERSLLSSPERAVSAQVMGTVAGWEPGTEFRLDNGQVWKVLKGAAKLPKPRNAPTVKLVPGLGGRWFLEVDEDLPKARVYRID
jgi:hypothetical protein